jgi:hypothetical protein
VLYNDWGPNYPEVASTDRFREDAWSKFELVATMPLEAKIGDYNYKLSGQWVPDTHIDGLYPSLPTASTYVVEKPFVIKVNSCTQKVDCGG